MTKITQKKLKAFTMLEILMITVIVGVGLLTIVVSVTKVKSRVNSTKQEIIATQLAKEGIEMVYQIRNTNLLKHSNYKDYCRLNQNTEENCNDNTNTSRITTGNYILSGLSLNSNGNSLDISDGINTGDLEFNLCLNGGQRTSCQGSDNQSRFGKFFRTIEGKGLYIKDVPYTGGLEISCPNAGAGGTIESENYTCGPGDDNHPMEFQFCSRVEYVGTKSDNVEICGILTNFFE